MAIRHVLEPWGMSYVLGTCFMGSDLIISGLISRGLGGEALGQARKFGETLGLPRAGGPKNEGDGPSPKTGWVASKTVGDLPKTREGTSLGPSSNGCAQYSEQFLGCEKAEIAERHKENQGRA